MIKAIIFDFGNVICTFDNNIFLEKIAQFTDKPVSELNKLIYHLSGLPVQYETGLITSDEFFKEIVKLCGLNMNKHEFRKAFTGIFTPIPTTFGLIKRLKSDYKLGLLSNTSEWDFQYGIRPIEIFHLFDSVSPSYQVQAMKPAKEIFEDSLAKLALFPPECVYIDDIQEFVEVAKQLELNAIHYTSYDSLADSLHELGVET